MIKKDSTQEPFGTYELKGFRKFLRDYSSSLAPSRFNLRLSLLLRRLAGIRSVGMVDAEVYGIKMRLYPGDNLGDRYVLFSPFYFEKEEREYLPVYLKPDSIFVDVGANSGFYSLYALKYIEEGKGTILALEPNPEMFRRLTTNLSFNQAQAVIPLEMGVAAKEGKFRLNLSTTNLGGASIRQAAGVNEAGSVEVKCFPLLKIFKQQGLKRVDFLKIDIEGAETETLIPFFEKAPRELYPRTILIESTEGLRLEDYGYHFIKRTISHNAIYSMLD